MKTHIQRIESASVVRRRNHHIQSMPLWLAFIVPALLLVLAAPGAAQAARSSDIRPPMRAPHTLYLAPCAPSSIVVTSTADSGAGTLRQALVDLCPDGTITFAPELTAGGPATITLTSDQLSIEKPVTIDGPGSALLAISGDRALRMFVVGIGVHATIEGLTLRDGRAGSGGAIYNLGALTVTDSSIFGNRAIDAGGGIVSYDAALTVIGGDIRNNRAGTSGGGVHIANGALELIDTEFVSNTASVFGGGLYNLNSSIGVTNSLFTSNTAMIGGGIMSGGITGTLTLSASTFSGNVASFSGGAISNGGVLTATGSTFSSNRSLSLGGGLHNGGVARTYNCTFTGNRSSADGGGIYNGASLTLDHDTLSGNTAATRGGSLYNGVWLTVTSSVFLSSTASLGGGLYNDRGRALISDTTIAANLAISNGGGIASNHVSATLSIVNSALINNSTQARGGGLYTVRSRAQVTGSNILSNTAAFDGGGIANISGTVTILASALTANAANYEGGGIATYDGEFTIAESTLATNTALLGGAIRSISVVTITTSNFVSNAAGYGGAIYNDGPLFIARSQLLGNTADNEGGAIMNYATASISGTSLAENVANTGGGVSNYFAVLTVTDSAFVSNTASYGGGIAGYFGVINADTCSLLGNRATIDGGGIYLENGSAAYLSRSTLANNSAAQTGGGISNQGTSTLHVENSTLSGNHAGSGGGIFGSSVNGGGAITLTHSTLGGNSASVSGGGIENQETLHLRNTIIAGSLQGNDCHNTDALATNANNLVEDGSCSPALQGDPSLGPLAQNGGATATRALLPGSPAIGAGDATVCAAVGTDQRGVARPQGAACDIGAFEARGFTLAMQSGDSQRALIGRPFTDPLVVGISAPPVIAAGAVFTDPVDSGRVRFTAPAIGAGALPAIYTATIAGAVAAYTPTANLTPGSYAVTAVASGAGTPVTFTLTNQVTTTTTLASSPNPSAVGESIVFTATVSSTAAPLAATGYVTFTAGSTLLGVAACDVSGVATVSTNSLVFGVHSITAHYGGDVRFLASDAAPITQSVHLLPLARNDAAGALPGREVSIDPRTNDLDPADGGLTIVEVGRPSHGDLVFDANAIRYTAAAPGAALDTVTYTVRDINGRTASALITVIVSSPAETDTAPQIGVFDNSDGALLTFVHDGVTVDVQVPAGSYTGALTPTDIVYLAWTALLDERHSPPAGLYFGGFAFALEFFVNDVPLPGYRFPQPLTLLIAYDPALLAGLEENSLVLQYWDGSQWSGDGITVVRRDLPAHTLTVTVSHLSHFALFAQATPTALDPGPEPDLMVNRHYLPFISR